MLPVSFNEFIFIYAVLPTGLLLLSSFLIPALPVDAVNWSRCLNDIRNGTWTSGGTDHQGRPAPLNASTTAISYHLCREACGTGPEPIQWSVFSQQFSSWLLPWLALVSQLPFGANDKLENLTAMLLTVGSPTLAAYSLALTLLNGRWVARRFLSCNYPNTRNAARILNSLQQSPLRVVSEGPLLASLIVLPENNKWWAELVDWLDYTYTWSSPAAASTVLVIVSYTFTVINSFTSDLTNGIHATGQAVGSVWICLLPIFVGWLQISPKCDSVRLRKTVDHVNGIAYVAGFTPDDEPILAKDTATEYGLSLALVTWDDLRCDEGCTVPIYNYARFLTWAQTAETVASRFDAASENARELRPVKGGDWEVNESSSRIHDGNRTGTAFQVERYCLGRGEFQGATRPPEVRSRMLIASVSAVLLQWGTTGAAVMAQWFTPTPGMSS